MITGTAVDTVEKFWTEVWQYPHNLDAIDELVAEDFTITTGGVEIVGREPLKEWVRNFQSKLHYCQFKIVEMFSAANGSRVVTRWHVNGRNNGMMGTEPDQRPVEFTGISVIQIAPDGRLLHNWVERSAWETFSKLNAKKLAA